VTHYEVIIFIGYLAIYIKPFFHYIVLYIESWCCTILNLHCMLCCLYNYDASDARCLPFHIISTKHSIITQEATSQWVLFLWQPSDFIDLFVDWLYFCVTLRK